MNRISLPRLIFWVVTALSIPLALIVGAWVAEGRIRELSALIGLPVLGALVFGVSQWLWPLAVGSIFLQGTMPFLPAAFKALELLLVLLLARFVIDDVVFKKRWIRPGPKPDYFFILVLLAVVLFHGIQDRFAMRFFGSDIWGGRSYFNLLLAFAVYFVLQSTSLNLRAFRHLPSIAVALGAIEFASYAVTFAVPDLVTPISLVYSSVASSFENDFGRRLGFAGNFGYLLLFWSLSDCRIQDFLQKGRFFKAAIFALGLLLCVLSGYRSAVLVAAIVVSVAAIRDFGAAAIFMLMPVTLALALVAVLHLAGVQLPAAVQRGLTMVPGVDWDEAAAVDANNSLEFREQVREVWIKQQFVKHPLLGRGFGLHPEDMMATMPYISDEIGGYSETMLSLSKYSRDEAFVVSGNLHLGFFSAIDRFGLIGAICFVSWTLVALRRMFAELVSSRTRAMNPALQWLALYIISFTVAFPFGALKVEEFLPNQLFLCGLFAALLSATHRASSAQPMRENSVPYPRASDVAL